MSHMEEMIAGHPEFLDRAVLTLDARLNFTKDAVPKLAMATAVRVIAKWGHPTADITHLVVSTNAGAHSLGTDEWLAALLGLRATVQRTILYMHGCSASCSALRLAKDIAENNHGVRVLVACTEVFLIVFAGPDKAHLDTLITHCHLATTPAPSLWAPTRELPLNTLSSTWCIIGWGARARVW